MTPPLGCGQLQGGAHTTGGQYGTKGLSPRLQAATAAAGGTAGGVGGDRRHILDAPNLDASTRERPQRRLRTRPRRLRAVAPLRGARERDERTEDGRREAEVEVGGG